MLKSAWVLVFAMLLTGAFAPRPALGTERDWRDAFGNDMIQAPKAVGVPDVLQPAAAGNNSCRSAFNKVCDEPLNCAAGTDSHDCTLGFGR